MNVPKFFFANIKRHFSPLSSGYSLREFSPLTMPIYMLDRDGNVMEKTLDEVCFVLCVLCFVLFWFFEVGSGWVWYESWDFWVFLLFQDGEEKGKERERRGRGGGERKEGNVPCTLSIMKKNGLAWDASPSTS